MRPPPPIFGTHEIDYRLGPIFLKNHDKYLAETAEVERLEKLMEDDKDLNLIPQMFAAQHSRFEAGVVTLLSATSLLERVLYEFACSHIHFKSYEENLDRLKLESKWLILPKLCAGVQLDEDSSEINELRQLVKARNAVVHPKVQFIRADTSSVPNGDKELARFHIACKNARRTVESLFAVLNNSAKGKKRTSGDNSDNSGMDASCGI